MSISNVVSVFKTPIRYGHGPCDMVQYLLVQYLLVDTQTLVKFINESPQNFELKISQNFNLKFYRLNPISVTWSSKFGNWSMEIKLSSALLCIRPFDCAWNVENKKNVSN